MRKNALFLLAGTIFIALILSIYCLVSVKVGKTEAVIENAVKTSISDKNSQLDLPFLESLTRHFLALVH